MLPPPLNSRLQSLSACARQVVWNDKKKTGFTLVELSIVLVIIGLIVGGVLVGRDLINAAKLRAVLIDIEKFNAAANTFRTKYNCLPGDCLNATDYFGTFASCGAYSVDSPNLSNSTCNGDGNGRVLFINPSDPHPPPANYYMFDETIQFWQQLSLAGLIKGKYSGFTLAGGGGIDPGVNAPQSSLENGCYSINYSNLDPVLAAQFLPTSPMYSNVITIGNSTSENGTGTLLSTCTEGLYSLPAISAQNLDSKIDDGKPTIGNVQTSISRYNGGWNYSGRAIPGCTNEDGSIPYPSASVTYHTSATTTACQLFFKVAF